MTADELRPLAARLEEHADLHGDLANHDTEQAQWERDLRSAAAYLRACADALEAGPVATAWMLRGELVNAFPRPPRNESDLRYWIDKGYSEAPLYTLAMPAQAQPMRLPEPMTDAEIMELYRAVPKGYLSRDGHAGIRLARAIEAETLRRVKEANK